MDTVRENVHVLPDYQLILHCQNDSMAIIYIQKRVCTLRFSTFSCTELFAAGGTAGEKEERPYGQAAVGMHSVVKVEKGI